MKEETFRDYRSVHQITNTLLSFFFFNLANIYFDVYITAVAAVQVEMGNLRA